MSKEQTKVHAAPNALQDFTSCPHWGMGGQFVYDPATQTRTRVDAAPAATGDKPAAKKAAAKKPAAKKAKPAGAQQAATETSAQDGAAASAASSDANTVKGAARA